MLAWMEENFDAGQALVDVVATSDELLSVVMDTFKRVAPMIDYLCAAVEPKF